MTSRVHCKDFAMARTIRSALFAAGVTLGLALTAGQQAPFWSSSPQR
jgi:hypothetical protein